MHPNLQPASRYYQRAFRRGLPAQENTRVGGIILPSSPTAGLFIRRAEPAIRHEEFWSLLPEAVQDSQVLSLFGRRLEEYGLSYREAPASSNGAVDPSLVVPHSNDRLQHFDG